ncbi:MAG: winged helix-turn-helix domain-containing protein [Nitrososphaerales archaeon]
MSDPDSGFNEARAEVFEALGHPVRIRILRILETGPLGFNELKKAVGIESSGHLQFHLGKLSHLVSTDASGAYALTEDGKEALRIIDLSRNESGGAASGRRVLRAPALKAIVACLLVLVIVLSAAAVFQQQQIESLSGELGSATTVLDGRQYWYLPMDSPTLNGTYTTFHGVVFAFLYPPDGETSGTIRLTNGSLVAFNPSTTIAMSYNATAPSAGTRTAVSGGQVGIFFGEVVVTFPNGSTETFHPYNLTYHLNTLQFTWTTPTPNPWFSTNVSPQVAIAIQGASIVYYVSVD